MILLLALAAAVSSPEPSAAPKLLALEIEAVSVAKDDAKAIDSRILAELSTLATIDVMSTAEVRRLMALEADKQSIGCDDESCMGELAGALGARLVLFGSVSRLGDKTTLTLSLYDAQSAGKVRRETIEAPTPADLAPLLRGAVFRLVGGAGIEVPDLPASAAAQEDDGTSPLVWVGAAGLGVGALGALGSTLLVALSEANVQSPNLLAADKRSSQLVGRVAIGGAAVGVVLGAAGGAVLAVGMFE